MTQIFMLVLIRFDLRSVWIYLGSVFVVFQVFLETYTGGYVLLLCYIKIVKNCIARCLCLLICFCILSLFSLRKILLP